MLVSFSVNCERLNTILHNPFSVGVFIDFGVGQCEDTIMLRAYVDMTIFSKVKQFTSQCNEFVLPSFRDVI